MKIPGILTGTPTQPKQDGNLYGDDDMLTLNYNGHLFNLDTEFAKHFDGDEDYQWVKDALRAKDDWIVTNSEKRVHSLLNALGIPQHVVDLTGKGVFNPEKKAFEVGGVWSRSRELLARI